MLKLTVLVFQFEIEDTNQIMNTAALSPRCNQAASVHDYPPSNPSSWFDRAKRSDLSVSWLQDLHAPSSLQAYSHVEDTA